MHRFIVLLTSDHCISASVIDKKVTKITENTVMYIFSFYRLNKFSVFH